MSKSKNFGLFLSILKALTCLDNQGGHKWHCYKACNWMQILYELVKFVKNPIGQMVRPQFTFCIPFSKDSLRFQRVTSNLFFLHPVTKTDFLCIQLQNFWKLKFSSNLILEAQSMINNTWNDNLIQASLTQVSLLTTEFYIKIFSLLSSLVITGVVVKWKTDCSWSQAISWLVVGWETLTFLS